MQVFDFSQLFGPCDLLPSYELSLAKPPKVQMQTLQLIIALSRPEQQPESLPGGNGVKQAQGCRNSRLSWWDSHIPIRATIGAQKKFLFLQVFVFPLQCIFSSCSLFFVEPESSLLCVYLLVLLEPAKNLEASFCPRRCTETRKDLCPAGRKSAYEQIKQLMLVWGMDILLTRFSLQTTLQLIGESWDSQQELL